MGWSPPETLSIVNYDEAPSPDYAFRFLGNLTADPDFLALVRETTINGLAATYNFDVDTGYTNVLPVPEPATVGVGFGLALAGVALCRRVRRTGAGRA